VYVARTAEYPQPDYENFLNAASRSLGRKAIIETAASTHLTFLDSGGTTRKFREHKYTVGDVRDFRGEMQKHLIEQGLCEKTVVHVDPRLPLVTHGARRTKLALNILEDERLHLQREHIEEFVLDRFGELPKFMSFRPHVTIGELKNATLNEEYPNPRELFTSSENEGPVIIPGSVALNGLVVYLDQIVD
jgi:hypothetical protein